MPCFYCNVSDAWLFRERSKRLWVTFAGAHCDLICWALAVFVWRLTLQDGLWNYLAWVVLTVCGFRVFFNFNPLLKLDGYYLLSDLSGVPNLRQEANDGVLAYLRWMLWGAPRPRIDRRTLLLAGFGFVTWLYGVVFLGLMFVALTYYGRATLGLMGMAASVGLGLYVIKGMFKGLSGGEVRTMLTTRTTRALVWSGAMIILLTGVLIVPIEQHASGSFELRPRRRVELRAPVAGFLRTVRFTEGEQVPQDGVVAALDVPDLDSRIAQKRAELAEAESKLRLLKAGPRWEEVAEQRSRVDEARRWHELAQDDLVKAKMAFEADLDHFDEMIRQYEIEVKYAAESFQRAKEMMATQALSQQEYRDWQRKHEISGALLRQQINLRQGRLALGTSVSEAEVARRAKELAEAKSVLAVLELGPRPEEVAAQEAFVARVREEATYLEGVRTRLEVRSALGGVVVTPRLTESVGQYLREGDLICTIEECETLEAEVTFKEQELVHVEEGQPIELKARGVPYQVFRSNINRIAPRATAGEVQSTVALYCRVPDPGRRLKPGMTGYARVLCGKRPIARVASDRILRSIRTEFWW
jgi:multidrug efflux pump subunit AcrA (membrane-fusion protein)